MKHLIIILLFFPSVVFSQNYYPLDKAPDTIAPTSPLNLVANNITQTTVILNWTAATDNVGVTSYRIYNNGILLINSTGNVTTYMVTGLTADTLYGLTVRAIDAAGNESNDSNNEAFSTHTIVVVDTQNPTAPINLVASNITENSVDLTWTPSTDNVNVLGYNIYRVNNGVSIIATISYLTSYTLSGLNDNTPYSIFIRAFDDAGNQSDNSNTETFTTNAIPDTQNPNAPISLAANNITETTVDLSWTAATDNVAVIDYRIYNNGILLVGSTGNVTDYIVTGLTPGTLYNLTVRAIDAANNESSDSNTQEFTTEIPDTENPTAPINLISSNITTYTVDLSWTESTDNVAVTTYKIYNDDIELVDTVSNNTSYTLNGLTPDTEYSLTVRAFDAAGNESENSNTEVFTTLSQSLTENLPEEDIYFDCYLLPLAQKDQLQQALDTYGCVRLEVGDYSGTPITMTSNQSLYGPRTTNLNDKKVPTITIAAGSTNVLIDNVNPLNTITFEAGAPITNCTLKSTYYVNIITTGGQIENCEFINMDHAQFLLDCSLSGYIRNNRVYKQWTQTSSLQIMMKGNSTTPSYGNVQSSIIYQTSTGNVSDVDLMGDMKYVGIDSEAWGITNNATESMLKMTNMTDVFIADIGGSNNAVSQKTSAFDIGADNLTIFGRSIEDGQSIESTLRGNTNLLQINSKNHDDVNLPTGSTGFNFKAHVSGNDVLYNGVQQTSTITNPAIVSNIKNVLLKPQYTPIDKYAYPTPPNPTGTNWAINRIGQTDSTSYIQGLIDADGVAELPEGIFYISSTLVLNAFEGINGAGTGKTAIVGITDDFPLITMTDIFTRSFVLNNLTLQGGNVGVRLTPLNYANAFQLASNNWKRVIFRNQNYGIHIDRIYGVDTNVIEEFMFIDCNIGIFQDPDPAPFTGETNVMSYVDKLMLYRCQFINNGIALYMNATRANNLNAYHECLFDGNGVVAEMRNNNHPIFTNCDIVNTTGDYVFAGGQISMYSCNMSGNSVSDLFKLIILRLEGCTILDNVPLIPDNISNPQRAYLWNNTIAGTKGVIDDGVFINNIFTNDATLSKFMVNIKSGVQTTIIDEPSTPYPQLLVKH